MDEDDQSKIISLIKQKEAGITLSDLIKTLQMDDKTLTPHLQYLSQQNIISITKQGINQIIKYQDKKDVDHLLQMKNKLNQEEYLIYQLIYNSKNQGILKKDIKNKVGIGGNNLNKIIKELETQHYIKAVEGTKSKQKSKLYVAYDVIISEDISGGFFYNEGEMDTEFIKLLQQEIIKNLQRNSSLDLLQITKILGTVKSKNNQQKEQIEQRHAQALLNMLLFDDSIEELKGYEPPKYCISNWNNVKNPILEFPPLSKTPCGHCQLINECFPGGKISPENCIYFENFSNW